MLTRFAPTPSGYLHRGNAANALLVSWLAHREGGQVALRIDDADAQRRRPEYVSDVFEVLDWLGVDWQVGPRDAAELEESWSQSLRIDRYREALAAAGDLGAPFYACTCTRSMLSGPATGGCPAGCRQAGRSPRVGETVIRLHIPPGTLREVDGRMVDVAATVGDVVVWRRDDLPAYHLTSIVDDEDLGITHVVRGRDLVESTAVQQVLAESCGLAVMARATVLHHALLTDSGGRKLSKSQLGGDARLPRDAATLDQVTQDARLLGAPLGITPPA